MLVVTEQAATAIREILDESEAGPEGGLRISGMVDGEETSLEFTLADRPEDGDEVIRDKGATLFLDGVASGALSDKTLDAEAHGDHFHFSLAEQD
jgi:Fe-S cluster assembly iron-binding protein IscA